MDNGNHAITLDNNLGDKTKNERWPSDGDVLTTQTFWQKFLMRSKAGLTDSYLTGSFLRYCLRVFPRIEVIVNGRQRRLVSVPIFSILNRRRPSLDLVANPYDRSRDLEFPMWLISRTTSCDFSRLAGCSPSAKSTLDRDRSGFGICGPLVPMVVFVVTNGITDGSCRSGSASIQSVLVQCGIGFRGYE